MGMMQDSFGKVMKDSSTQKPRAFSSNQTSEDNFSAPSQTIKKKVTRKKIS